MIDYSDPANRAYLNTRRVTTPDVADEAEFFEICPECGEAVDCRLLGDALHHDEPGHARINRAQ